MLQQVVEQLMSNAAAAGEQCNCVLATCHCTVVHLRAALTHPCRPAEGQQWVKSMLNIKSNTLRTLWQFRQSLLEWESLLHFQHTLSKVCQPTGLEAHQSISRANMQHVRPALCTTEQG